MKNLKLILALFLFTQLNFAQQTYKVTEGELQFVNPEKGIIIKKNKDYYILKLSFSFSYDSLKVDNYSEKLSENEFKILSKQKSNIFYESIDSSINLKKLNNTKFVASEKDEAFSLFKINDLFFAGFKEDKTNKTTRLEYSYPFLYLTFNGKTILYTFRHERFYIIPTKNNFIVFIQDEKTNFIQKKLKLTNKEYASFSSEINSNDTDDFYRIYENSDGKKLLKNFNNDVLIKKTYDSIFFRNVIICEREQKFDVFNYNYKKISKTPLRAFHFYGGFIQGITKNRITQFNYLGKVVTNNDKKIHSKLFLFNDHEDRDEGIGSDLVIEDLIITSKVNNRTNEITLINTDSIQDFFFTNFKKKISTSKNNYKNSDLFYKLKNGKYGFSKIKYLSENISDDYKNEFLEYYLKYRSLDKIEVTKYNFYKLYKNNKIALYPIVKDFRYKKLLDFEGFYARFELQNGQKGWLSKDGKEYLDE